MAKPLRKQSIRIDRRKNRHVLGKPGERKVPGSMNRHKPAATGNGKRTRTQIAAASQRATA